MLAGRELLVERGRMAEQANGSVTLTYGGTTVLVTAVMAKHPRIGGGDFFPLTVDFEEKLYAAGKIKGSRFMKREGRATDEAILTGRLIDRSLRPRFNQRMRNEVQVISTVLSIDGENDPDVLGMVASSLALGLSDIPWDGPIGAVRVGIIGGEFVVNPTYAQRKEALLDIVVAGTKEHINMIEAGAREVSEEQLAKALKEAEKYLRENIAFQEKIIAEVAPVKTEVPISMPDAELEKFVREYTKGKLEEAIYQPKKALMAEKLHVLKEGLEEAAREKWAEKAVEKVAQADYFFEEEISRIVHENVLKHEKRPDGRKLNELRNISCEVGVLTRTHGSSLFNRGNTQALGVVTLGGPGAQQIIENIEEPREFKKRFMLHYNFPPFSARHPWPISRRPGPRMGFTSPTENGGKL